MKTYPILYTRDSIGNIRVWYAEQEDNKYRIVAGLQDGKKVVSQWTEAFAKNVGKKNATTDTEQAEVEVLAKYKKQKKTGYFEDVSDVDQFQYVEPMLAKNYKDYSSKLNIFNGEWLAQTKYNGHRCVATKEGLFTREGEKYVSVPHIERSLRPFFEQHPDAVLDGELFNNELRQFLNEISKLVRKTVNVTKEDLDKSEKLVRYYIYDGFGFDGLHKDVIYQDRKNWIDSNVFSIDYLSNVQDTHILNQDDLNNIYNALVEDGHEGCMLRNKKSAYEHKRSKNLLKLKPEDDSEAVIVDIIEGTGNWSKAGKTISLNWNGKVFDASFKGTYEQAVEFLNNKSSWIGKEVTFLYMGLTGKGTPNYARIDINNCLKK